MPAPRLWLSDPSAFGQDSKPEWINPNSAEGKRLGGPVELHAARIQHELIYRVRGVRRQYGIRNWTELVEKLPDLQLGVYQMREIARGEDRITVRQIAALDLHFGELVVVGAAAAFALRDSASWRARER